MAPDFIGTSAKMIGSLLLIIGLILFIFYLYKRFRINSGSLDRYPAMRLLGTLNLAPKRAVALVEIMDQWFMIGVGTESVNMISKIDRPDNIENLNNLNTNSDQNYFSNIFNKLITKKEDA